MDLKSLHAAGSRVRDTLGPMNSLQERVQCEALARKVMPVEAAVRFVEDGATLAVSGFTRLDRVEGWWRAYEAACRAFRPEGP
jgi:hypothetical protein